MLEAKYTLKRDTPSDINEHLPTLRALASECRHITEAGVRSVVSSYAFATALKGKADHTLVQVDLKKSAQVTTFQAECAAEGVNTVFYEESDLSCPLAETDLLFIDTWHIYGHLKRELARWHSYAKTYIVLHDTTVDEWEGETIRCGWDAVAQSKESGIPIEEIRKGLWPAIEEFLKEHPEWHLAKRYTNNNGLTILKRGNDGPMSAANDSLLLLVHGSANASLLTQTVDKSRIHLVFATKEPVPVDGVGYASVTPYSGDFPHEFAIDAAQQKGSHLCVMEGQHKLEPHVLQMLLDSKDKGVIAPMLVSTTRYSNYHAKVAANGYCVDDPLYDDLLYKRVKGQIDVPVVNGIYFVNHALLPKIKYIDGTRRDSYVIMSDALRKQGIPQYLDNRQFHGTIR